MKNFFQFLSESTAVQQAKRMGLVGDGHGGWYDKKGEFVAKTEKGQLKFYNKRQKILMLRKDYHRQLQVVKFKNHKVRLKLKKQKEL